MLKSSREHKHNDWAMITYMAASDADTLLCGNGVYWNEPATGPLGVKISAFRLKLHFKKFGNVIWGYYC